MGKLFDLRLSAAAHHVQVHYPLATSFTVLVPALGALALLRLIAAVAPRGEELWPLALGLWCGLTVCQLAHLLWWSAVTFDLERGLVRRGPQSLARLEDLLAVEQDRGVALVFRAGRTGRWSWRLPRMSAAEAATVGAALAESLGVPLVIGGPTLTARV